MAAKTSVDYYWRFEFIQNQAGSENAKIKIEHLKDQDPTTGEWTSTTMQSELEVTSTDASSPTVWTGMSTGCYAPGDMDLDGGRVNQTHRFKVSLLNEYYLDADNDRTVTWKLACYAPKWMWDAGGGDVTKVYKGALANVPSATKDYDMESDSNFTAYTPGTDKADYMECMGANYEGDSNGTVNTEGGWHDLLISIDYVAADLQTPSDGVYTY